MVTQRGPRTRVALHERRRNRNAKEDWRTAHATSIAVTADAKGSRMLCSLPYMPPQPSGRVQSNSQATESVAFPKGNAGPRGL